MEQRFAVRRRADGWAVTDIKGQFIERRFDSETAAKRFAAAEDARERQALHTYAVVWYCEVDAVNESEATVKARKFLAASYRDGWEPLSVDEIAPR